MFTLLPMDFITIGFHTLLLFLYELLHLFFLMFDCLFSLFYFLSFDFALFFPSLPFHRTPFSFLHLSYHLITLPFSTFESLSLVSILWSIVHLLSFHFSPISFHSIFSSRLLPLHTPPLTITPLPSPPPPLSPHPQFLSSHLLLHLLVSILCK